MQIFISFLLSALNLSCLQNDRVDINNYSESLTDKIFFDERPLSDIITINNIKVDDLSVLIDKSDYTLGIMNADTVVKLYPVVLGLNPIGDKMQEGDYKTPEGVFGIRDKYPHKNWNYFIWIDYPNEESWVRFDQRKSEGVISKDAKIGGEIGIHGTSEGGDFLIDNKENWTWGCISLKNHHLNEIYPYFHKKIKITIQA